jgi:hypothetical protein
MKFFKLAIVTVVTEKPGGINRLRIENCEIDITIDYHTWPFEIASDHFEQHTIGLKSTQSL